MLVDAGYYQKNRGLGMIRFVSALLLVTGGSALADLADEVRCNEIGFSVAAENRDAGTFAAYIDDDARFVGQSAIRGPAAITEAWAPFLTEGGPLIKWRPQFTEVLEDGRLALTRGPYRLTVTDESGNPTEHWGTFNSVWRLKPDGSWKVVFDAGSNPTETPSDEVKALLDAEHGCDL
jgi:ketosteroid isomerase-like protein